MVRFWGYLYLDFSLRSDFCSTMAQTFVQALSRICSDTQNVMQLLSTLCPDFGLSSDLYATNFEQPLSRLCCDIGICSDFRAAIVQSTFRFGYMTRLLCYFCPESHATIVQKVFHQNFMQRLSCNRYPDYVLTMVSVHTFARPLSRLSCNHRFPDLSRNEFRVLTSTSPK